MTDVGDRTPATVTGAPAALTGTLGTWSLVFTVLAYNAPLAVMAGYAPLVVGLGNGVGAPVAFAAAGVVLGVFSVGLVAMGRHMHSPGAFYAYVSAGLGRVPGLGGAFVATVGYLAVCTGSYAFSGIVISSLVEGLLRGPALPWWVCALGLWAVVSTLSLFKIEVSARVLGILLTAEIAIVVVWECVVFADGGPEGIPWQGLSLSAATSGNVGFAFLFGAFAITGFEAVAVFRQEARDPERTVPRATYLSVLLIAGFYAVGALAYLTALGPTEAIRAGSSDPYGSFLGTVSTFLGTIAADVVTVLVVTSAFAALLSAQNISARYLFTLGGDGVLPRPLGRVHPRTASPLVAAATVAAIVLVGILVATAGRLDPTVFYAALGGFGGLCILSLMVVTAVAILVYFRRNRTAGPSVLRTVVSPVLAFVGLATVLTLALGNVDVIIGGTPSQGALACVVLAAVWGAGVLTALVLRRGRPEIYRRIGRQDL